MNNLIWRNPFAPLEMCVQWEIFLGGASFVSSAGQQTFCWQNCDNQAVICKHKCLYISYRAHIGWIFFTEKTRAFMNNYNFTMFVCKLRTPSCSRYEYFHVYLAYRRQTGNVVTRQTFDRAPRLTRPLTAHISRGDLAKVVEWGWVWVCQRGLSPSKDVPWDNLIPSETVVISNQLRLLYLHICLPFLIRMSCRKVVVRHSINPNYAFRSYHPPPPPLPPPALSQCNFATHVYVSGTIRQHIARYYKHTIPKYIWVAHVVTWKF